MASSSSGTIGSCQKDIEDELKDCGIRLSNLPHSTEELLNLLDKVESLLFKVGQAPSDSMKDALLPVMRAMIGNELLKHADEDVKVSVVSCVSELSRITAPQQPYDDGLMKEIFQLIVRVFEELSHSGHRYYKAVQILETVADVKASVILLDLECDTLVIEIFELFLRIIRPDHPSILFRNMEQIMTLLIEESDEISMELLQSLLDSVKKENQIGSPISSKLGEKVLKECASTVKPYLVEVLKSTSMNLDDYAEIVASICNEMPEGEQVMATGNASDAVYPGNVTLMEDGTPLTNKDTSSKKLQHRNRMGQQKKTDISTGSHGFCGRAKKRESATDKDAHLGRLVPEGDVLQSQDKRNGSMDTIRNFGNEGKGTCSKRKSRGSSRKNESVSKGDGGTTSSLNIKEGNVADSEEPSVQQVDEKKLKKDRATIDIHDIDGSKNKAIKLPIGDEKLSSKLSKTKSPRKLAMGTNEGSKRRHFTKYYGEEIVGARIRVWWPLDKVFYEGTVSSFDPVARKHEITYDDGELEVLNLRREKWEMVADYPSDKERDLESNAVSSVLSTKKAKRTSSTKRGVSSSKRSKRNAQKSGIKSVDIPILDKMNDATDVGCQPSSGKEDVLDKEDDRTLVVIALESSLTQGHSQLCQKLSNGALESSLIEEAKI